MPSLAGVLEALTAMAEAPSEEFTRQTAKFASSGRMSVAATVTGVPVVKNDWTLAGQSRIRRAIAPESGRDLIGAAAGEIGQSAIDAALGLSEVAAVSDDGVNFVEQTKP